MKKAALLGDSIRLIGYGQKCAELLSDEFETFLPEENGMFAKYTLRMALWEWKPKLEGCDVIHWNNGLWDVCDLGDGPFTPVDEYVATLVRISKVLKNYTKNIIFATSTPTSPDMWGHDIERAKAYNKAAVDALTAEGVKINDLFTTVAADIPGNICADNIHLSEKGIALCAAQTADIIRKTVFN